MSAPSLIITVGVEASVQVLADCSNDSEQLRLEDWINAHGELRQLVNLALELRSAA